MDDAIICKVFPISLKGKALSWFTWLLPNSIDCFQTLMAGFGIQFTTRRPIHLTSVVLVSLRLIKKETLWSFMKRFGKVSLDIWNLDPEVAMHHLVTGLWPGPFVNSLCKKPATDLGDLHCRATKYMQLEEFIEYDRQLRNKVPGPKKKVERDIQKGKEYVCGTPKPRYNYYNPLNASKSRILEQALATEVLAVSKCANTPPRDHPSKHCWYHRNKGCLTEECMTLKDKIEDFNKKRCLKDFVYKPFTQH